MYHSIAFHPQTKYISTDNSVHIPPRLQRPPSKFAFEASTDAPPSHSSQRSPSMGSRFRRLQQQPVEIKDRLVPTTSFGVDVCRYTIRNGQERQRFQDRRAGKSMDMFIWFFCIKSSRPRPRRYRLHSSIALKTVNNSCKQQLVCQLSRSSVLLNVPDLAATSTKNTEYTYI